MKIETQHLEDQQVKLTVEVEQGQLDDAKRQAARKIAKSAKIPGFRPGKAPYNIVERHVGESAIMEEAIELLVNSIYPKVIEESGIDPYGPGSLENIPSRDPLTFEFKVPLAATVTLGEYKSVRIPYDLQPIEDSQVEQTIENIREQQAVVEPVERPAQDGDEVTILLKADRKEVKEGENPTFIRERSVPVVIRTEAGTEETGEEWPFPGFSRNLVGLSAGDEKTIPYRFPEDSTFELLRGSEVEYHFVVESVKSRTLPEPDDELAKSVSEFETFEDLRKDIRERLETQSKENYDQEYEDKVLGEILKDTQVKYPPQMVDEEIHSLIHQLENRLSYQGLDLETYLKSRQMDEGALHEELKPVAEDRLKRFLTLMEISRTEKLELDPEEVSKEAGKTLQMYAGSMQQGKQPPNLSQSQIQALVSNVAADMTVQASLDRLRDIASGEAEKVERTATEAAQDEIPLEAKQEAAQAEAAVPEPQSEPAEAVESKPKPKTRKKKLKAEE